VADEVTRPRPEGEDDVHDIQVMISSAAHPTNVRSLKVGFFNFSSCFSVVLHNDHPLPWIWNMHVILQVNGMQIKFAVIKSELEMWANAQRDGHQCWIVNYNYN